MPAYETTVKSKEVGEITEIANHYPKNSPIVYRGKAYIQRILFHISEKNVKVTAPSGYPATYLEGSIRHGALRKWKWEKID